MITTMCESSSSVDFFFFFFFLPPPKYKSRFDFSMIFEYSRERCLHNWNNVPQEVNLKKKKKHNKARFELNILKSGTFSHHTAPHPVVTCLI